MRHHRHCMIVAVVLPFLLGGSISPAESDQLHTHAGDRLPLNNTAHEAQDEREDAGLHESHSQEAVTSMAATHAHMGPHFRWTTLRGANPADQQRAAEIVTGLRNTLEPYRDYRKRSRMATNRFSRT